MQTLDVISINIWQIIVSLLNLVILFLIIKKFLYKPVRKMLDTRQKAIDDAYLQSERAKCEAMQSKNTYLQKLDSAKLEAESIIQSAVCSAKERESEIIAKAKADADCIVQRAHENAELEMKKANETIKSEIVDASTLLAQKLLEREINQNDHNKIVDSFFEQIDSLGDLQ